MRVRPSAYSARELAQRPQVITTLRLRRGERVELHAATDPHLVWRQLDVLSPGGYGFAYLQDGPDRWRMQVTRRLAG